MTASPLSVSENDDILSSREEPRKRHCNKNSFNASINKECKVCGDKAVGYNFSVITCESCKAFFRRNANRERELPRCPFDNKCQISVISRRFCQSCRLKRCIQVGMKREWIMNENYRRVRKARLTSLPEKSDDLNKLLNEIGDVDVTVPKDMLIQLFRKTTVGFKPPRCQCKCTCGFYPRDTPLIAQAQAIPCLSQGVSNSKNTTETTLGMLNRPTPMYTSNSTQPQSCNQQSYFSWQQPSVSYFQNSSSNFFGQTSTNIPNFNPPLATFSSNYDQAPLVNAMNATIQSEYGVEPTSTMSQVLPNRPYSSPTLVQPQEVLVTVNEYSRFLNPISQTTEPQSPILVLPEGLNHHERFLLQELIIANGILKQPLDAGLILKPAEEITLMEVARITDLALRRIIRMAKELSYFRELSEEDQIALLKGSGSELLILRGVMVFNPLQDTWDQIITHGENGMKLKLDIFKRAKEIQHYEEHKKFLLTFNERWRRNENVMLLLSAIVLFRPDRPSIRDYDTIMRDQQQYYSLLKRYLRLQCPNDIEAEQAYDMLLRKLIDLHQLSQGMMRIIYGLNVNEMDPLLLELFDLTKHRKINEGMR